ncbi:MAG: hypothetical protein WB586_26675 [Chthoniobacterales bacterium]
MKITKRRAGQADEIDPRFGPVVDAFAADRAVSRGKGKGFGTGALKVNGKIFAMMSSKGKFVVKLPKERVDELLRSGKGERFNPGQGKLMKEWVVVLARETAWIDLAKEAPTVRYRAQFHFELTFQLVLDFGIHSARQKRRPPKAIVESAMLFLES